MDTAGSDLSEMEHIARALDIGFYACRKILEEREKRRRKMMGAVSKNRTTVAHMADTEG